MPERDAALVVADRQMLSIGQEDGGANGRPFGQGRPFAAVDRSLRSRAWL